MKEVSPQIEIASPGGQFLASTRYDESSVQSSETLVGSIEEQVDQPSLPEFAPDVQQAFAEQTMFVREHGDALDHLSYVQEPYGLLKKFWPGMAFAPAAVVAEAPITSSTGLMILNYGLRGLYDLA